MEDVYDPQAFFEDKNKLINTINNTITSFLKNEYKIDLYTVKRLVERHKVKLFNIKCDCGLIYEEHDYLFVPTENKNIFIYVHRDLYLKYLKLINILNRAEGVQILSDKSIGIQREVLTQIEEELKVL